MNAPQSVAWPDMAWKSTRDDARYDRGYSDGYNGRLMSSHGGAYAEGYCDGLSDNRTEPDWPDWDEDEIPF